MRISILAAFSVVLAAATADKCRAGTPDSSSNDGIGYTTILAKNPEGKLVNTAIAPYDINVQCVRDKGVSQWKAQGNLYQFLCTMETEGDGTEGSAGKSTFTYTFRKVSPHFLQLVSIANSKVGVFPYSHSYNLIINTKRVDPSQ